MQGFKAFFLMLMTLISLSGMAQSIQFNNPGDGQITVVGHGFSSNRQDSFQVNFYANGQFIQDINTGNGSFSYTFPRNTLNYNDRVEVKVLNFYGSGSHFTDSEIYRADQPTPTPIPTPQYSHQEIVNYANQQARTVANRIANTYGKLENWKYNFTAGFFKAIRYYRTSSTTGVGYDVGLQAGASEGFNAGKNQANSLADSNAAKIIESRFEAAVNTGKLPSNVVPNSDPDFSGFNPSDINIGYVSERLETLQNRLYNQAGSYVWSDGFSVQLDRDFFRLDSLSSSSEAYSFVDSWFREDRALEEWANNNLGGGYDYTIYNRLDNSGKSVFVGAFKNIYSNVIDEKFYSVKTAHNGTANSYGYEVGREYAELLNYKQSYEAGYTNEYRRNTTRGFDATYPQSFSNNFTTKFNHYATNPVIKLGDVVLSEENKNGVYELEEKLSITVSEVKNIGGVAGNNLSVSLSGSSITALTPGQISIPALSKVGAKSYNDLAKINADAASDVTQRINAQIGEKYFSLNFVISWAQVLKVYGESNATDSNYAKLQGYILKSLENELKEALAQKKNVYKEGTSRLTKLVQSLNTLPNTSAANFSDLKPKLLAMTEKPSFMKWGKETKIKKSFLETVNKL